MEIEKLLASLGFLRRKVRKVVGGHRGETIVEHLFVAHELIAELVEDKPLPTASLAKLVELAKVAEAKHKAKDEAKAAAAEVAERRCQTIRREAAAARMADGARLGSPAPTYHDEASQTEAAPQQQQPHRQQADEADPNAGGGTGGGNGGNVVTTAWVPSPSLPAIRMLRGMVLPMLAMFSIIFCMGIPQVRGAPESTQPHKPHAAKEDKAHMDIPKVRGAPEHEPQKPHLANESLVADTSSSAGSAKFAKSDQKASRSTKRSSRLTC